MTGERSVNRVVDELIVWPAVNFANPSAFPLAGRSTCTVTADVVSAMGDGETVTVAFVKPNLLKISFAACVASAFVAPGTMTALHASYEALSTTCLAMLMRVSSIAPNTSNSKTGNTKANSTVVAPYLRQRDGMPVFSCFFRVCILGHPPIW